MTRGRRGPFVPVRLTVVVFVVVLAGVAAWMVLTRPSSVAARVERPLGPGAVTVRLDIEHSRFHPARVRVVPHTDVRFVVVNHDPIGHELIVGDGEVHARHEHGTEPSHPPRPGEVSIDPDARASTTYSFHEPGRVLFACHLPGHFAYGMKGWVIVESA